MCCHCDSIQGEMCAVSVIVYREMCCYWDRIQGEMCAVIVIVYSEKCVLLL